MEGVKAGLVGGVAATIASAAAQSYSPLYRSFRPSFKVFLGVAAVSASFFTVTDRAAMRADREFAQKFSISEEEEVMAMTTTKGMKDWSPEELKRAFMRNKVIDFITKKQTTHSYIIFLTFFSKDGNTGLGLFLYSGINTTVQFLSEVFSF
jgi:hypothetical protein